MSLSRLDLHLHSTASDGSDPPESLASHASRAGVEVIALTDHDALDGIGPLQAAAEDEGLRVIPGVELSVNEHGLDVHVLAYGFDTGHAGLRKAIATWREARRERAKKILARLKGLGIRIPLDAVEAIADGGALGRPHVAEALVRDGVVDTVNEAFQHYLGHHARAYVPKQTVPLDQAAAVVHDAGGVAVLAHPGTLNRDQYIAEWAGRGLDGIEVWHTKHDAAAVRRYRGMAERLGLLMTGGTDYHGERTPGVRIGSVAVPDEILGPLDEALRARRSAARS